MSDDFQIADPYGDEQHKGQRYTHLVVIFREQEPSVVGFCSLKEAMKYADDAGAQWSETYVTQIIKGPLV
jgi:hypothetical protein